MVTLLVHVKIPRNVRIVPECITAYYVIPKIILLQKTGSSSREYRITQPIILMVAINDQRLYFQITNQLISPYMEITPLWQTILLNPQIKPFRP
ncbi:unnamed protein product [Meloidogyne enterolobii]|uniref:Uncharacterized protein n=1 Tax=Meloidogyne enterolobii TaxID=390850 RepID=A0ACB0Z1S8_MELEN